MYTFGDITLTPQALGIFIVYTAMAFMVLVMTKTPSAFVLVFATGCYVTYATNCMVVGKCETLAWFLVGLTAFSGLVLGSKAFKLIK